MVVELAFWLSVPAAYIVILYLMQRENFKQNFKEYAL